MRIFWTNLASALIFLGALRAESLAFKWSTEVSMANPYEAQAMQGESFALEATLVQYGAPLTGEATATFYYQTKQMASTEWFSAPAAWDEATATASVTWSPALDVGQSAYRWFFGIDTAQGHNYRAYGTLRLKPSPGFSPALLEPIDLREQLKAELYAQLQADLSAAFAADLQAEAAAREEADSAITQAVNALQDDLAAHNHDGAYLKLTGGTMSGTILSALSKASDPGLTITLGQGDRYYAKHTQAGIQARRALSDPEEFYAFFSVSGTNQIARLGDLEPLATKAALAAKAEATHNHEMGDVDGLETALAAKAALEHTHSQSQIQGLNDLLSTYLTKALAEETYQPKGAYLTAESDPTVSAWAKAATKPTYTWTEILNRPTTWDWANLTNKPTAFTPAAHNHDGTYLKLSGGTVTGNVTLNGTGNYVNNLIFGGTAAEAGLKVRGIWGKPSGNTNQKAELYLNLPLQSEGDVGTDAYFSTPQYGVYIRGGWGSDAINYLALRRIDGDTFYAPKTHSHTVSAITDFPTTWDWANLTNKPTAFTPATHTHAIADTTGLQAALEALAPLSSVTCTTNNVTYIWQWDEAAGTFALRAK